jgi:hypothetical protein
MNMNMQLQKIQDVLGNDYIAIVVDGKSIEDIINGMNDKITDFDKYNEKLLERNHGTYHITVFNVMECKKNPDCLHYAGTVVSDAIFKGIGSIEKNGQTTMFIVVESDTIQALRCDAGFPDKDLHVTIAFTDKDLFHARKNECNVVTFAGYLRSLG